jgi:hypothetical protein
MTGRPYLTAHSRKRRGLSLLLVISILVILVVIATGFVAFTTQDMKASQTNYEQNECYFLAESGIDYGLFLLKHSMTVYPAPPTAWVDGHTPVNYDADGDGTADQPGAFVDLAQGKNPEHVVISDLGYSPSQNWMSPVKTCGSFLLQQNVTSSGSTYTVQLTSTGFIRSIPNNGTNYSDFANVSNWTIIARRTIQAKVDLVAGSTITSRQGLLLKEFNETFR